MGFGLLEIQGDQPRTQRQTGCSRESAPQIFFDPLSINPPTHRYTRVGMLPKIVTWAETTHAMANRQNVPATGRTRRLYRSPPLRDRSWRYTARRRPAHESRPAKAMSVTCPESFKMAIGAEVLTRQWG